LSKNEREKYNEKALCKFIGGIFIAVGVLAIPLLIENIAHWYRLPFIIAVPIIAVFAAVYCNTGNRFMKK